MGWMTKKQASHDDSDGLVGQVNLADIPFVEVAWSSIAQLSEKSDAELLGILSHYAPGLWELSTHQQHQLIEYLRNWLTALRGAESVRTELSEKLSSVAVELARLRYVVRELGTKMYEKGAFTERIELDDDLAFALFRAAKPLMLKHTARELGGFKAPEDIGDHSPFRMGNKREFEAAFASGTSALECMGFQVVGTDIETKNEVGPNTVSYVLVFDCELLPTHVSQVGQRPQLNKEQLEEAVRAYMPSTTTVSCKVRVTL